MVCELCGEVRRAVYENNNAFCVVAKWPLVDGHLLVLPKRCVISSDQLDAKELADMFSIINKVIDIEKNCIVGLNTGSCCSQPQHLHFHTMPSSIGLRGLFAKPERLYPDVSDDDMKKMEEKYRRLLNE